MYDPSLPTVEQKSAETVSLNPKLIRKLKWLKWLSLIGGVFTTCAGTYELNNQRRLQTQGTVIEGRLFDTSVLDTGKGRHSYTIVVDYDPKEMPRGIRKSFNVSKDAYDEAVRTRKTSVRYLPSDPTDSAIGTRIVPNIEPIAIGIGLILIAIASQAYLTWKKRQLLNYLLRVSQPSSVH
jgi:Protein of unknown function (DUF3592)